jgi:3-oxoacyl-[acyl-carrier protein] reductase
MAMKDSGSLAGRVALVTGSSRGLGREIAMELGRRGARVAMNYANDRASAEATFAELARVSPKSILVRADVTDAGEVERFVGEVRESLGPVDILVPNATCAQPLLPIEEYDMAFFQTMYDFFVMSPVLFIKACLPHMKQQKWGRIIQLTSEVFHLGVPNFTAYVAAKGGQTGLSRSLARELAPWGITVNMISPGWIPTERHASDPQEMKDEYLATIPAGRCGTPADVASAAAFFASDEAAFITFQTVSFNGGHTVF